MKHLDTTPLSKLSEKSAGNLRQTSLYAHDVVIALKDFINDNFRGLAEVTIDKSDPTIIKISPEYLAYLTKLVLKYTNGEAFTTIKASVTSRGIDIAYETDSDITLTKSEQMDIVTAARTAGFDIFPINRGFLLYAPAEKKQGAAYVYANGTKWLHDIFNKTFFS